MKNEQNTEPDPHKVGNFFIDPCISLKDDLGIDPDDDIEDQLYDVIDHSTEIAEKPCVFEREADSISRDVEEEQAFVAKAKGKDVYILYGYPAFNEYDGIGCDPTFEYYVGTKDEAMRRFDNIRYNEPPMRKRIADVKEQLDGIALGTIHTCLTMMKRLLIRWRIICQILLCWRSRKQSPIKESVLRTRKQDIPPFWRPASFL